MKVRTSVPPDVRTWRWQGSVKAPAVLLDHILSHTTIESFNGLAISVSPTHRPSIPSVALPATRMISDRDLFSLAVFFGAASVLLILAYHFLETNAVANKAEHAKSS
ncbi:hypothetical protein J3459_006468 [Metarhizium acridum]|uniref:uncharacterized protein n=1 Tax=Metarhizium acridum TaxID=92637 RepID=UPI001C6AA0C7|nr:hypothetical protein J3458_005185 [Metarhizium acridum]KAG8427668.1 hypothetical protein J3459_006468 [Metarhizium acridum]